MILHLEDKLAIKDNLKKGWIKQENTDDIKKWLSYFLDDIRNESKELSDFRKIILSPLEHTQELILNVNFCKDIPMFIPYLRVFRMPGIGTAFYLSGSKTEWLKELTLPNINFSIEKLNYIQMEDLYGVDKIVLGKSHIFVPKPLTPVFEHFIEHERFAESFESIDTSLNLLFATSIYGSKDIFTIKFTNGIFGSLKQTTNYLVTPFGHKLLSNKFIINKNDKNIFDSLSRYLKLDLEKENMENVYNYFAEGCLRSLTR